MIRLLPLLILAACIGPIGKPVADDTGGAPAAYSTCESADGYPFDIGGMDTAGGASIEGDTLSVDVGYGGGCQEHEFVLCWPGGAFVTDGERDAAALEIWHGGVRDNCEAYLSETLTFDLVPLKTAWQVDHTGPGEVDVSLDGWPASLLYTFE